MLLGFTTVFFTNYLKNKVHNDLINVTTKEITAHNCTAVPFSFHGAYFSLS